MTKCTMAAWVGAVHRTALIDQSAGKRSVAIEINRRYLIRFVFFLDRLSATNFRLFASAPVAPAG